MSRVDAPSLVAGLALVGLGTLFLLDRLEALDLRFGYLWPAVLASLGAILLASGLAAEGRK
jgi:cell wall-active antibiotic response 4TMS protein YvqF